MSQATNLQGMTDQQLLDELVHRGVLDRSEVIHRPAADPPPRVKCAVDRYDHFAGEIRTECCTWADPPTHILYQAEIPIRELHPHSSHPTDRSQDAHD